MIFTLTLNPALDKQYSVDNLIMNDVLHAKEIQLDYGGKGFNVSRMLANLGQPSTALGFLGGKTGEIMREGLISQAINLIEIPVAEETRTNITVVSTLDNRHIKVNEKGPQIQKNEIDLLIERVTALASPNNLWVLSGSLPPGVPVDIYNTLIYLIKSKGGSVILDTSGVALKEGLKAGPKLVKPNLFELSQLTGSELNSLDMVLAKLDQVGKVGAENLAVSAGSHGALITDGDQAWVCVPPQIKEINPVGAGDAMVAGLTRSYFNGDDLVTSLKWGVACGTAAAMQSGTKMPEKAIVEEVFRKVTIEEG